MNASVSLVVEPLTVRTRPSAPATGSIWLIGEAGAYPADHWNDFVVVLLTWWCTAMTRLLQGESMCETVRFMEGPFQVDVSYTDSGDIEFVSRTGPQRAEASRLGAATLSEFALSVLDQSRRVLKECRSNYWTQDSEDLTEAAASLADALGACKRRRH